MDWLALLSAFLLGFGLGTLRVIERRAHHRGPRPPMRRRHYVAPARQPRIVTEQEAWQHRAMWDAALVSFALKASLCRSMSERAVVESGVVSGWADYRVYQKLLRQAGVWVVPKPSSRVRWASGWSPARLRAGLRCGLVTPPYPAAAPPPIA